MQIRVGPQLVTCMYLQAEIKGAHEFAMLSLAWHPAGHLLASGGQVRAAPGSSAVLCKCMTHYSSSTAGCLFYPSQ